MKGNTLATSPEQYLEELEEPRKGELLHIHQLIRATVPDLEPFMISGMIGYGRFHYKYASGREGDWCKVALASQKNYISMYCCAADDRGYVAERYRERLPKASIGKSCVRFKRLADLDEAVVQELLRETAVIEFQM